MNWSLILSFVGKWGRQGLTGMKSLNGCSPAMLLVVNISGKAPHLGHESSETECQGEHLKSRQKLINK